jgi:hypothetical protein
VDARERRDPFNGGGVLRRVSAVMRAILAVGIATSAAAAQGTPVGSVAGSVVDSLHLRSLGGGSVVLTQQSAPAGSPAKVLAVATTPEGLFSADSLPPGRYLAVLSVPELDSLGIALAPQPVDVAPGHPTPVAIALPSLATVTAQSCPTGAVGPKRGMMVGRVLDGNTGQPLVGAQVVVQWIDVWFDKTKGIRQATRVRYSATAAGGVYRVCDLPSILTLITQAQAAERTSPPLDLQLGPTGLARQDFTVGTQTGGPATASLSGTVRNSDGRALANVEVSVLGTKATTRTTADGKFTLDHLPAGTLTVEAKQIGYLPHRTPVQLASDSVRTAAITMSRRAATLDSVLVYAKKRYALSDIPGFKYRKEHLHGTFLDSATIASRVPVVATDVIRDVPGIELDWTGSDYVITSTRGTHSATETCSPTIWVDNVQVQDINWVQPVDIKAVEVYTSPLDAPTEFVRGSASCGLILIWTQRGGSGNTK